MVSRPKPGETEEDILRQQAEFYSRNLSPAVTVVRHPGKRRSPENGGKPQERDMVSMDATPMDTTALDSNIPRKKSRFKSRKEKSKHVHFEDDPESLLDKHDRDLTKVLSEIVERDVAQAPILMPSKTTHGFPAVLHRGDVQSSSGNQTQKKSLFAQQFDQMAVTDFGINPARSLQSAPPSFIATHSGHSQGRSGIIDGTGLNVPSADQEMKSIHEENVSKMAVMSEQEILNEQKKLMEMLDPDLVAFLRSKQKKMSEPSESSSESAPVSHVEQMDVESSEEQKGKDSISEEELPIKPEKDWMHMDKIETEKLSWMKDLPPPSASNHKGGQQARFDLNGDVVPVDADMPTNLGLHHHGHEPERAGYSLEELFTLARSANMQQRVFALHLLAKIITNARNGDFHELLQKPVIPALLDGGLLFLVRWALDDSTDNTMAAAVQCLQAVLVHKTDEDYLEHTLTWHKGCEVQALSPAVPEVPEDEEERPQETDADVIKQDLIRGLLRMTLLVRLRYILEVWKPPAPVISHIMDILIRMARHSTQSAYEILQCPRIVAVIFENFLPTVWQSQDEGKGLKSAYGCPLPKAMKLMHVMCTAGRHIAANLVSNYKLFDCIMRYTAVSKSELQLPSKDAHQLIVWSLNTWKICSCYGHGAVYFREYYPAIMTHLQHIQTLSAQSDPDDVQVASCILSVLESILHIASSATDMAKQPIEGDSIPLPPINWSHVTGLLQPVQSCMQRHLQELFADYPVKKHNISLLTSSLNFLASYVSKLQNQPGSDAVESLDFVENLCNNYLLPCLSSHAFQVIVANLSLCSLVLCPAVTARDEAVANLPEQGSCVGNQASLAPILVSHTPYHFLTAFFRLLIAAAKMHKGFTEKLFRPVLENHDLIVYIRKVCIANNPLVSSNHFVHFENNLHLLLINMARKLLEMPGQKLSEAHLYHQMSLHLMTRLKSGDEHLLHELLSTVLFNFVFLHDIRHDQTSGILESLHLQDSAPLESVTRQPVDVDRGHLLTDITANLSSIRASYIMAFSHLSHQVQKSRSRCLNIPHEVERYLLGGCDQVLVPRDWMYLPILDLYQKTLDLQEKAGVSEENVPPSLITAVANTLRWVYFLHSWRSRIMDSVSMATKLTRVMCTFLAGSDLFLHKDIHCYLAALLEFYCRTNVLDHVDFTEHIPGIASFYDFYTALLTQYEAVSFGDQVFACYVLYPLLQKHKMELRRCVWGEHAGILRFLSLPIKQLQIPLKRFLEPPEENVELVRLYYISLLSQAVRHQWSPVMYIIALHHVNMFMYSQTAEHAEFRRSMLRQSIQCPHQELRQHLLYYKYGNTEAELGFDMYDPLPAIRQKTLDGLSNQ